MTNGVARPSTEPEVAQSLVPDEAQQVARGAPQVVRGVQQASETLHRCSGGRRHVAQPLPDRPRTACRRRRRRRHHGVEGLDEADPVDQAVVRLEVERHATARQAGEHVHLPQRRVARAAARRGSGTGARRARSGRCRRAGVAMDLRCRIHVRVVVECQQARQRARLQAVTERRADRPLEHRAHESVGEVAAPPFGGTSTNSAPMFIGRSCGLEQEERLVYGGQPRHATILPRRGPGRHLANG